MSVRRTLSVLGAGCLATGCLLLAGAVSTADDSVVASLAHWVYGVTGVELATPSPSPAPSASPAPRRRRGRTTFGIKGTTMVSDQVQSGTTGSQSVNNLFGIEASLEHRTDSTVFSAMLPAALAVRSGSVGDLDASFVAQKYALFYRTESLTPFGQLSVGTLPRSIGLATTLGRTDAEFLVGSAPADATRNFRLAGVRLKRTVGTGTAALGLLGAESTDGGATAFTLMGGYQTGPGKIDGVFEGALSRTRGMLDSPDANAAGSFQLRINDGGGASYVSYIERYLNPSFVALGGATTQGDRYHGIDYHRSGKVSLDLESVVESQMGNDTLVGEVQNRSSLSLSRAVGKGGALTASFSTQRTVSDSDTDWIGQAMVGYGFAIGKGAFLSTSAGEEREVSMLNGATSSLRLEGDFSTTLGTSTRLESDLSTTSQIGAVQQSLNKSLRTVISRTFGRYTIGLNDDFARITGTLQDGIQNATYVTVARKLNNSTSVQIEYGMQSSHDRFAPMTQPRTSLFNISIGAPFALGNGVTTGVADSRLPASITGAVVNSALATGGSGGGMAGITVVLDGTQTRRTDFLGHFDFPFVTAGPHEISIDPAALPRGFTADFPFLSVNVGGGQTAQATLSISAAAAIEGHIYGLAADGTRIPISNIGVELDGKQRDDTGPNGGYGFGKLAAGTHTVQLIPTTLPADFLITGDLKRTVTSRLGQVTQLDFLSAPLGSISGTVGVSQPLEGLPAGPISNAYVVAEPGEHAAITDENGAYVIDNLPPGSYDLSVDPETLPIDDGTADDQKVTLDAGAHVQGIAFKIEQKARDIDFSFKGVQATTLSVDLVKSVLPPGGSTTIVVSSSAKVDAVKLTAFGKTTALTSRDGRHWNGELIVPLGTRNGPAPIEVGAASVVEHATVGVDATLPIATLTLIPAHPPAGSYATVRARFAAPVKQGDRIRWEDGTVSVLGKPLSGRVFQITVKITKLPLAGLLYCTGEVLPITLGGR